MPRGGIKCAAVLALLCAAPAAVAQDEPVPPPLRGIRNLKIRYYDVTGRTVADIRRSKETARPADPADPSRRLDALTRWRVDYGWQTDESDGCKVIEPHAELDAEILLPRLGVRGGVPKTVLEAWDRFVEALEANEAKYLRDAEAEVGSVVSAVAASSCEGAKSAGAAALAALSRRQAGRRLLKEERFKGRF